MRALVLATVLAFAVGAGCMCGPAGIDEQRFACSTSEECLPGFNCVDGECTDETTGALTDGGFCEGPCGDAAVDAGPDAGSDGGRPDAGTEDAGDDAGEEDAGATDAGEEDGGEVDAGEEDAGTCVPTAETCGDGLDNDCDLFVDCADADCAAGSCGPNGRVCGGASCVCSGNGGAPQTSELACSDGADNDCDGLVDCADPTCAGLTCGASGRVCTELGCVCSGNGGLPQASETACTDGADNDCDGLADCADPQCESATCTPLGLTCQGGACLCPPDAGTTFPPESACSNVADDDCDGLIDCADPQCAGLACGSGGRTCHAAVCTCHPDGSPPAPNETACADGADDDCDGLVDCADDDCAGATCGSHGTVCAGGACVCSGNGSTPQATEQSCGDVADNDCDGLADCNDPDCAQAACGPSKTCISGLCVCLGTTGGYEPVEQTCLDGLDNDCDGQTDCADPDCGERACAAGSSTSICCGGTCADLTTNPSHCGGCGLRCKAGQSCQTVTVGSVVSGWCSCFSNTHCPNSQSCKSNHCGCSSASQCAAGQTCTGTPGVCHY